MTEFIRLIYWNNLQCTTTDIEAHYTHLHQHNLITAIKDMHLTNGVVLCDFFIRSKPKPKRQLQTYLQTLRNTKQIRHFLFLGTYTGGGPQPRILQPPKKDYVTIYEYLKVIDQQIQQTLRQKHQKIKIFARGVRPEVPSHA